MAVASNNEISLLINKPIGKLVNIVSVFGNIIYIFLFEDQEYVSSIKKFSSKIHYDQFIKTNQRCKTDF